MLKFQKNKSYLLFVVILFSILSGADFVITGETFSLGQETIDAIGEKYGNDARARLISWQNMIKDDKSVKDLEKIEKVNRFFNQMEFVNDIDHWGENDYWATPIEFLGSGGGDCEDFSLSKYFSLLAMGVSEKK